MPARTLAVHRGYPCRSGFRSLPETPPTGGGETVSSAGQVMIQKLRVPMGFVLAAVVLYLAEPTAVSILAGLPVAIVGAVFRGLAAGVIKKDSTLATSGV